ncbi:hypothetical protein ANN_25250 [Periplaneta americana]|uniref:Uncharacterized protein n=1 Tax=Periplaneta americana TaxID=6978 RepID=A0ABQ8S0U5_PERAM|nr:hypothetical protein ANN_25250 [Periplaneta americana]
MPPPSSPTATAIATVMMMITMMTLMMRVNIIHLQYLVLIFDTSSSLLAISVWYIFFFMEPQRKKSNGVRSLRDEVNDNSTLLTDLVNGNLANVRTQAEYPVQPLECRQIPHPIVTCPNSCGIHEHKRNLRLYYPEKSAVAQHSIEKEHKILFDHTKVINKSSHYWDRTIKEAIEIKLEKNNFNRDSGLQLSQAWTPALDQLRPSYNQGHEDHGPRTATDSNRRNRARRPPNFTQ